MSEIKIFTNLEMTSQTNFSITILPPYKYNKCEFQTYYKCEFQNVTKIN